MKRPISLGIFLTSVLALASSPRVRLERIDASKFADDGTVDVYASVLEMEGMVIDDKTQQHFSLSINGKNYLPKAVRPFRATKQPIDLVLVVESSALYGPSTAATPAAPAPPPPPKILPPPPVRGKKGARKVPPVRATKPPPPVPAPVPPVAPGTAPKFKKVGEEPLEAVKESLRQLLDSLQESLGANSRLLLIDYGGAVTPHPPFRPVGAAASDVDDLSPDEESGDLRLTDAVRAALLELGRQDRESNKRRLIVVISDGLNSQMDRKTFRALGDTAATAHVPIHTIGFSPSDERGPLLNLGEVSKRSNGTFRWAKTSEDLRSQIETLADELNNQYVLTFDVDISSLEGKNFVLHCEDLESNALVYDPSGGTFGFGKASASRGRWRWWLLVTITLVGLIWGRRYWSRRPRGTRVRSQPWQLVITTGASTGRKFPLTTRTVSVGKSQANYVIADDPAISGSHAEFYVHNGEVIVSDLNSTNGTWVNDERISVPTRLRPNDRVQLGATVFVVELVDQSKAKG